MFLCWWWAPFMYETGDGVRDYLFGGCVFFIEQYRKEEKWKTKRIQKTKKQMWRKHKCAKKIIMRLWAEQNIFGWCAMFQPHKKHEFRLRATSQKTRREEKCSRDDSIFSLPCLFSALTWMHHTPFQVAGFSCSCHVLPLCRPSPPSFFVLFKSPLTLVAFTYTDPRLFCWSWECTEHAHKQCCCMLLVMHVMQTAWCIWEARHAEASMCSW